jgi:hypothetical protein
MNKKVISGIVVVSLAVSYIGAKIYATNLVEESLNRNIAGVKSFAAIRYADVSVSPLSGSVEISDVVITPRNYRSQEITIDTIMINDIDTDSPVPTYLDVEIEGIKLDIEQLGSMGRKAKKELALKDLETFNLASRYEYSDKEFDWELTLSAEDLAAINYSLNLENVDFNPQQPATLLFNYQDFQLASAQLNYTDDSLAEKMFEQEAAKQNISVSDLKEKTIQSMNRKITKIKAKQANSTAEEQDENAFIIGMLEAFIDFTADPDGFEISIIPKTPVTLSDLQRLKRSPGKLLSMLDVKLQAK